MHISELADRRVKAPGAGRPGWATRSSSRSSTSTRTGAGPACRSSRPTRAPSSRLADDEYDPTLYGMPASYDEQGNYEYPEDSTRRPASGGPATRSSARSGSTNTQRAWARFEAHRRQVEESRTAAGNRAVTSSSTPRTSATGTLVSDEALAALHEKLSHDTVDHEEAVQHDTVDRRTAGPHSRRPQRLGLGCGVQPGRRLLATAGNDGTVRLWDPAAGGTGAPDRPRSAVSGGRSPDGRLLATAGDDGTVRLWDPAAGGTGAP